MSSKDWFVIHDGHHIGPFSITEMKEMLTKGHLNQNQLTWKSGMGKWITIKSMIEEKTNPIPIPSEPERKKEVLSKEISTGPEEVSPPELPPVPTVEVKEEAPEIPAVGDITVEEETDDIPPPVPNFEVTPMEQMKLEIKKIQNKEVFEEAGEKKEEEQEVSPSSSVEYRLIPAAVLALVFCGGLYHAMTKLFPEKKGLAGLSPSQRKSLLRVFDQPIDKKIYFRYALAKKGDGLWITSNYKSKARVQVYLQNLKGQVLGEGPVKLSAEAILDGGFAFIKKWKIDKGYEVPYGKYTISLTGRPYDGDATYLKIFPFLKSYFKKNNHNISDRGNEILFYPGEIVKFEKELKNYQYKVKKNILGPLKEQTQRYESFLGMLNQISFLYREKLEKARRGKDMQAFEKQYNLEIGPLLRDLILDCNRQHLSFFNVDPKRAKIYDELVRYGKEVGEIAAVIAKETTSYKKLRKKNRTELFEKYDTKIEEIRLKGEGIISSLKEKISSFN